MTESHHRGEIEPLLAEQDRRNAFNGMRVLSRSCKPTVPELLPLVRLYYERNPVGGSLHIVLDDGNVEDGSVEFCLEEARQRGDVEGEALAEILLAMSRTQRNKLYRSKYGGA